MRRYRGKRRSAYHRRHAYKARYHRYPRFLNPRLPKNVYRITLTSNHTLHAPETTQDKWCSLNPPPLTLRDAWTNGENAETTPFYPFDQYRIRKIKVELWPQFSPFEHSYPYSNGSSMIDPDGNLLPECKNWNTDPFGWRSTRKSWNPNKYTKRYFTPKVRMLKISTPQADSSYMQPMGGRYMWWINTYDDTLPHYGVNWSIKMPNTNCPYTYNMKVKYYTEFRNFIQTRAP